MKIVLSPNPYRDRGLRSAQSAQRILENAGAQTAICLPFDLDQGSKLELPSGVALGQLEEELEDADVLVCFGGDGTILHAAHEANARGIPILGVNLGSIGFMAELEHGELSLLSRLAGGKFGIERRMMLDICVRREGRCVFSEQALNDAVLTKGAVARVLDLEVTGDRVVISSFSGDGLVVATPTGSTAYSMAAGGPIVEPTAENIIIAPICAHSLHAKPFVLGANRTVGARLAPGGKKTAYLSVDGGRAFRVQPGDWVECRRSRQATQLVKLTGRSFYERINQKLGKA
ncbi:MAG: NAD(+)/NADH kinase [Oscillospiraceae bacterium]|nr:NAD(+)/NADH kinase [Oscillospiraceae bacterium]MDE7170408.1 NAD(+)/NADH kinase [Oscillospiraceae bacterium]